MNHEYEATVDRVVDGDTIDLVVQLGFNVSIKQRFRLAGLDAPERGQVGWGLSANRLTEMLAHGLGKIQTQRKDKYGRWLVTLFNMDDMNINQKLIDEGFAKTYGGGARI